MVPASVCAYTLDSQIEASGYQEGDAFSLSFAINAYQRHTVSNYLDTYDDSSWDLITLAEDYYVMTQAQQYVGLSASTNKMRDSDNEDPGWANSTSVNGTFTYSSDGYLYSWISRKSNTGNEKLSDSYLLNMTVTIASNGKDSSTLTFTFPDRSSSITLNNVAIKANDIEIRDDIAFTGSFNHKDTQYNVDDANYIEITAGEIRSGDPTFFITSKEGAKAPVRLLSPNSSPSLTFSDFNGSFGWYASSDNGDMSIIEPQFQQEYNGNIIVHANTQLRNITGSVLNSTSSGLGLSYLAAPSNYIRVEGNGVLNLHGGETYYHIILEEGGMLYNGGGKDLKPTQASLPVVDLEGNAIVKADDTFGMIGKDFSPVYLNLNGHTLTKTGDSTFHLSHAVADAGIIDVQEGRVTLSAAYDENEPHSKHPNDLSRVEIKLAKGAEFMVETKEYEAGISSVSSVTGEGSTLLLADAALQVASAGILLKGDRDTMGEITNVNMISQGVLGNGDGAVMKNVLVQRAQGNINISDIELQNVQVESESEIGTLSLTDVIFTADCTFSAGTGSEISLSNAALSLSLQEQQSAGVYLVDLSNLFHGTVTGNLTIDLDTEALSAAGYTTIQLNFGTDDMTDCSGLLLSMDNATFAGTNGQIAEFTIIPEPTTATLSLLALAALATRRRRASR